jgi:HD-GYP domain-containing protein (c-di-GMP phosphodiesterase class II)
VYWHQARRQQRERTKLAIGFAITGATVLAGLVYLQPFPTPYWLWGVFAAAYVFFNMRAVEVNDRLYVSPTSMIIMTAAVAFGPASALLGTATTVALGFLHPDDVKERRWFQPAVNFGQLVLSTAVGIAVLTAFLHFANTGDGGAWTLGNDTLWIVVLGSAVAAVVHGNVNLWLVSFIVNRVYGGRHVQPWSHMGKIMLPLVGMGFLGGLLGAAYVMVGPATLPLIMVVFFIGHMAFESFARVREAQLSTLRGFIKALEAKDLYTRGHTERVAHFSEMIGKEMGFNGTRLEQLRWAALIHDVGKLAVPRDLIRKRARLTDDEYEQMQRHVHLVEDLLAEVEFLQPMVDVATDHHAHYDGNGYHATHREDGEGPPLEACILSVADSFDAMTSTRSYRVALSQDYALEELHRHAGTQFDPKVVEAFITALTVSGERYGLPDMNDDREARRIAERAPGAMRFPDSQRSAGDPGPSDTQEAIRG